MRCARENLSDIENSVPILEEGDVKTATTMLPALVNLMNAYGKGELEKDFRKKPKINNFFKKSSIFQIWLRNR